MYWTSICGCFNDLTKCLVLGYVSVLCIVNCCQLFLFKFWSVLIGSGRDLVYIVYLQLINLIFVVLNGTIWLLGNSIEKLWKLDKNCPDQIFAGRVWFYDFHIELLPGFLFN